MPPLKNPRREKFAQELAKGKTATEALGNAGYQEHRQAASRMLTNVDVKERVAELQERSAKKVAITVELQSSKLDEAYKLAKELKKPEAMTGAVREQSILHGLRIERQEHGAPGEFALADAEFADEVTERLEMARAVVEQGNATEH